MIGGTDSTLGGGGGIAQSDFKIEVYSPSGATPLWQGSAPLKFEIPPPVHRLRDDVVVPVGDSQKWRLRVTNNAATAANGNVVALYNGTRPILSVDVDLDSLNHFLKQ